MSRLADAWRAMAPEQRLAAIAAIALLLSMFLPWYGLQSLDRKTGAITSHAISAFGDVSFVEAAIFLVAAGVITMLLARADGRQFQLPGGDGTIVSIAGGWAALLIFFRVFSRPPGGGEPVGIEWGFFLAFVAAGALAFAGWRMRTGERPQAPLRRSSRPRPRPPGGSAGADRELAPRSATASASGPESGNEPGVAPRAQPPSAAPKIDPEAATVVTPAPAPAPRRRAASVATRERSPYPPAPPEQLSFEDPATHAE
jgi:hypothetical protein